MKNFPAKSKFDKKLILILKKIHSKLSFFGINLYTLFSLYRLKNYFYEAKMYKKMGGKIHSYKPVLTDYNSQAGIAKGHYFHQDLLVASLIFKKNPRRHIDIGSRIDGFVAHVASFRKIEVMDVRKLDIQEHTNIRFIKANLMKSPKYNGLADSISCLHAIEHFGLGRYGDPVEPDGHLIGFENIINLLKPNGLIYISVPIGKRNETHFNAHRIFHPKDILKWPSQKKMLKLVRFDFVDDLGFLHTNVNIKTKRISVKYGCGIYTFMKC